MGLISVAILTPETQPVLNPAVKFTGEVVYLLDLSSEGQHTPCPLKKYQAVPSTQVLRMPFGELWDSPTWARMPSQQ